MPPDATPEPAPAPVALITGGSSGIGLATARLLRAMGWRLALIARRPEPLAEARRTLAGDHPDGILTLEADVGDPTWDGAIIHAVMDRFGRVDAIVHAAGFAPSATLDETTPKLLRECFTVNTLALVELMRRGAPVLREQHDRRGRDGGDACLVAVSSYASADPFPGFLAYAGAKAAVNVMTRVLAQEGEAFGLRAYAVAPAAVETPMLRGLFSSEQVPENACLAPDDVAALIVRCITGDVDRPSGSTIYIKRTDEGVRVTDEPA